MLAVEWADGTTVDPKSARFSDDDVVTIREFIPHKMMRGATLVPELPPRLPFNWDRIYEYQIKHLRNCWSDTERPRVHERTPRGTTIHSPVAPELRTCASDASPPSPDGGCGVGNNVRDASDLEDSRVRESKASSVSAGGKVESGVRREPASGQGNTADPKRGRSKGRSARPAGQDQTAGAIQRAGATTIGARRPPKSSSSSPPSGSPHRRAKIGSGSGTSARRTE